MSRQASSSKLAKRRSPSGLSTGHNRSTNIPERQKTASDHCHEALFRSEQTKSATIQGQVDSPPFAGVDVDKSFSNLRSTLEHGTVVHSEENQRRINALCTAEQAIVMVDGGNTAESQLMVYNAITRYPSDAENHRVWTKVRILGPKKRVEYRCKGVDRDGVKCCHKSPTPQKARQHFVAGHVDEPCWSCPIEGCSDPRKYKRLDDLKHHHMVQYHRLDYTRSKVRETVPHSARLPPEGHQVSTTSGSTSVLLVGSASPSYPTLDLILSAYRLNGGPPSNPSSLRTTPSKSPLSHSLHTPNSNYDTPLPPLFESPSDCMSAPGVSQSVPHSPVLGPWYGNFDSPFASDAAICPDIHISGPVPGDPPHKTLLLDQYRALHAQTQGHGAFESTGSSGQMTRDSSLYPFCAGEAQPHGEVRTMPLSAPTGAFFQGHSAADWRITSLNNANESIVTSNSPLSRIAPTSPSLSHENSAGVNLSPVPVQHWQVPSPFGHALPYQFTGYAHNALISRPIGGQFNPAAAASYLPRVGFATAPPQNKLRQEGTRRPSLYDMTGSQQEGHFAASNPFPYNSHSTTSQPLTGPYSSIESNSETRSATSDHRRTWDAMTM